MAATRCRNRRLSTNRGTRKTQESERKDIMNETAKRAGCAVLGASTFIFSLPEINNSSATAPKIVRKEEEAKDEHNHEENGVPKPEEVRDFAVPAISSGLSQGPRPSITIASQEFPQMAICTQQPFIISGTIRVG